MYVLWCGTLSVKGLRVGYGHDETEYVRYVWSIYDLWLSFMTE